MSRSEGFGFWEARNGNRASDGAKRPQGFHSTSSGATGIDWSKGPVKKITTQNQNIYPYCWLESTKRPAATVWPVRNSEGGK